MNREEFAAAFEDAFGRLRNRIAGACAGQRQWPDQVAAAIRAAFDFAIEDTRAAYLLTREPLARGGGDEEHFQRLTAYLAELLQRAHQSSSTDGAVPAVAVDAIAGGVALLVGHRLANGRADELPAVGQETIQLVLAPYLGIEDARRIAAEHG